MHENPDRGTYVPDPSHVRMHPPDARAQTCDHCLTELPPGRVLVAVAPDSAVVHQSDPSLDDWRLARHASLSPQRLRQALRWNAWRPEPARQLPGGQPVPLADTSLSWHEPTVAGVRRG